MSKEQEASSVKDEKQGNKTESDDQSTREAGGKIINPQIVIAFILLFAFAVFAVVNTQEVSISFVFTNVDMPLIIVMLGSFFLGVITMALSSWRSGRKKQKNRK